MQPLKKSSPVAPELKDKIIGAGKRVLRIESESVADLMDRTLASEAGNATYPPYNIEKTDDDAWRISLAVAGFADDDLAIEVKDRNLHDIIGRALAINEIDQHPHIGFAQRARGAFGDELLNIGRVLPDRF